MTAPRSWGWRAGEDSDCVAVCVEVAGEDLTDLTGAAGDHDLHRVWPSGRSL